MKVISITGKCKYILLGSETHIWLQDPKADRTTHSQMEDFIRISCNAVVSSGEICGHSAPNH